MVVEIDDSGQATEQILAPGILSAELDLNFGEFDSARDEP
jgi:hypothetical protein